MQKDTKPKHTKEKLSDFGKYFLDDQGLPVPTSTLSDFKGEGKVASSILIPKVAVDHGKKSNGQEHPVHRVAKHVNIRYSGGDLYVLQGVFSHRLMIRSGSRCIIWAVRYSGGILLVRKLRTISASGIARYPV